MVHCLLSIRVAARPGRDVWRKTVAVRLANGQVTTKSVFVPPEKDEAEVMLTVAKDAKPQHQDMIVSGLMRANNQSIVRYTRAIPIQIVAP